MSKKKQPEILQNDDFEQGTSTNSIVGFLQDYKRPIILVIVGLVVLVAGYQILSSYNNDDDDKQDSTTTSSEDSNQTSTEAGETTASDEDNQYATFEKLNDDDYKITGKVTSVYDDAALDGNAGIVVEGKYKIDTKYNGSSPDVNEPGGADKVVVGDWVEVLATGRKSFSAEADYILTVFDAKYYVKQIDSPIPGDTSNTDDKDSEEKDDTEEQTDDKEDKEGGDEVAIKSARVSALNNLTLSLSYPGCGEHDFSLDRISVDAENKEVALRVVHDAHGDSCEKLSSSDETFDISEHIKEFEGKVPYDIELRDSRDGVLEFTVQ